MLTSVWEKLVRLQSLRGSLEGAPGMQTRAGIHTLYICSHPFSESACFVCFFLPKDLAGNHSADTLFVIKMGKFFSQ